MITTIRVYFTDGSDLTVTIDREIGSPPEIDTEFLLLDKGPGLSKFSINLSHVKYWETVIV